MKAMIRFWIELPSRVVCTTLLADDEESMNTCLNVDSEREDLLEASIERLRRHKNAHESGYLVR